MNMQKIILPVLTTLALYACSDEVANVPSEDPNAQALIDGGIVLANGKDQTPDVPKDSAVGTDSLDYTVYRNISVVSQEYPGIYIYEIDAVPFSSKKFVYSNDISTISDEIIVDSLSLSSPYLLIESCCFSSVRFKSIVDVRQSTQIVANVKTHLESSRLIHLVEAGMDFVAAKEQANREVLEAFGFYDDPSHADDFENVRSSRYKSYLTFIWNLLDWEITVDSAVAKITMCGSLDCGDSSQAASLVRAASNLFRSYQREEKDMTFLADFLALKSNLDRCTSANEGLVYEIPKENILLECKNNQWKATYKPIEYTTGTMTDARDGKTYKTVTYSMKGNSVTWMAEDLSYHDSSMQTPCKNCNYYYFDEALNLNTTAVQSVEACVAEDLGDRPNSISRDTAKIWMECRKRPYNRIDYPKFKSYADSVIAADGGFQGVCPEGWHLPQRSEWKALLDYLKDFYYPDMEDEWPGQGHNQVSRFMFEKSNENPAGFGLAYYSVDLDGGSSYSWNKYFVVFDKYGFGVLIDNGDVDLYSSEGHYIWEAPAVELVRCIKN